MGTINTLPNIDFTTVFLGFFAILFAVKEIIEIFCYFKKKWRIKTGVEQDKETLESRINTLEKHDNWQYKEILKISDGVQSINANLIDKEISDIRWELLDFCSALTSGRYYNREAFKHIFRMYEKYENILSNNNMTNGYVEESMKAVREIYHNKLINGEFT